MLLKPIGIVSTDVDAHFHKSISEANILEGIASEMEDPIGLDNLKGMICMKCLFLALDNESIKERDDLYNGMISARTIGEAFFSYYIRLHNTPPDDLIIFTSPDVICEFEDINENIVIKFIKSLYTWKEMSLHKDYHNFIKNIEQICTDAGVSPPNVYVVSISENADDRWDAFGKVKMIMDEIGFSKKNVCILAADASVCEPLTTAFGMITQLMEREGYNVEKLDVDAQNGIIVRTDTLLQSELYEAICRFTDTGKTEKLKMFCDRMLDPDMQELLKNLIVFAEDLSLCRIEELEPTLVRIYEEIDKLECSTDSFVRVLCGKLRAFFGISKPKLLSVVCIKSCLSWEWLTQSLIIFIDALPIELLKKKIVECDISGVSSATLTPEVELFYSHLTKDMPVPKEEELRELLYDYLHGKLGDDSRFLFIEDFIDIIENFVARMEEDGLTIPYDGMDILSSYPVEDNEGVRQILEFIDNNGFKTMSQFKRKLSANPDSITYFYKEPLIYDKKNPYSQKIIGIRYFSLKALRRKLKGFRLDIDYGSLSGFRRFIGYYLYLKIVRNMVCHAAPFRCIDDELNDMHKKALCRFGVDTGAVNADNLSRNIAAAIKSLEKFLSTKKKKTIDKYYIAIPGPGADGDKSDEIQSLFANVSRYDTVKLYVVINENTSKAYETAFLKELEEYSISNDFFINTEMINCPDDPSELLGKLISTAAQGDKISVDCTYMTVSHMCSIMLFLKAASEKKAEITNVVCRDQSLTELINSNLT